MSEIPMKKFFPSHCVALAFACTFSSSLSFGATVEENRKIISEAIPALSNISGANLYYLQILAEGTPDTGDPGTVATYNSLTPEARKKLALNFASKIKDGAALEKLAQDMAAMAISPEAAHKVIEDFLQAENDVDPSNLMLLKGLAAGMTMNDASEAKRKDTDTLATYEALPPDARKKLALNFAAKITNTEALAKLAKKMSRKTKSTSGMTPEAAHKVIAAALEAETDIKSGNLLFLKGLAGGKSYKDASAGKQTDPDTLATYESLTPEARKKLALNFAAKINDPTVLTQLAEEFPKPKTPKASAAPAAP